MSTKNIPVGSSSGTFAAGDDARFAQLAQNTTDISTLNTTTAGKAAKGANSDITSLTGLTTALSIAQGGTGSTTQNFVDLTTNQTVAGLKTFSNDLVITGSNGTVVTLINENQTNIPSGAFLNSATYIAGSHTRLTNAASGVNGEIEYTIAQSAYGGTIDATFDIYAGGGSGADGIWFYAGHTVSPVTENSLGGYSIFFSEYNSQIVLYYNGAIVTSVPFSNLGNSTWRTVRFTLSATGAVVVYVNGTSVMTFNDSVRALPGVKWGFGARCGSSSNEHRIRNMLVTTTGSYGLAVGAVNIRNGRIANVIDPAATQDAATKNYVDTMAATKAAKGANSDITSLTGLTTALSLAQGGTGATTATAARTNLGLGGSATLNVGTATGTVAAGDDSRIVSAAANTAAITKLSLNPTATKTAAYTAVAQDLVLADATSGPFTVTLPSAPADATLIEIKKLDSSANAVTIATSGSDTFTNGTASSTLAVQGHGVTLRYQLATTKWIGLHNDLPLTATDARYLASSTAATTYAPLANPTFTGTVSGITKTMVGLGSVDNTSDASKPVSAAQAAADLVVQSTLAGTNTQSTTAYTLVLTDAGKVIEMNNAAVNTVTVPTNASVAYPVATIIEVCQVGAGQTTIAAASGVTLRSPNGLRSAAQYATISLRKRATDEWVVSGYTTP